MSQSNARMAAAALVLAAACALIGGAWFVLIDPVLQGQLVDFTSGQSAYRQTVTLRLDSFSGYAPLRSERMQELLREQGIRLELEDDQADYADRIRALDSGRAQMGVFTIDGYVLAGADLGRFPGTIVSILDETSGADAMVAYEDAVPNLQALNNGKARLVLTPASPSEFLGRVAMAEFGLEQMTSRTWKSADGAGDVFAQMKAAAPSDLRGYVLWEPWVSRALELPGVHKLIDSSATRGYIVDVLVVERKFLAQHPEDVAAVLEAIFSTLYEAHEGPGMAGMVQDDAASTDPLSDAQAEDVADGILWRNALENYAAFGLVPLSRAAGVLLLEDAILNISSVLERTHAVSADPIGDRVTELFYPGVLNMLMQRDFHPAKGMGTADLASAGVDMVLPPLAEDEWQDLVSVGSMQVAPISFGRGRATLHVQGQRELDALARRLRSLPAFYLTVVGQARAEGDPEANLALAEARAEAARAHLIAAGIAKHRVRAVAAPPVDAGGAAQTVRFELGQRPY